ncbi:MAG: aminodeoxychorismate/anthranilate synthase component II [Bacteroidales bacterium]|nr:aminodeoxychorismate/anthranilate synthase component II [Bacteroidales bacterium]
MKRVLLVNNYDSFVHNVLQVLREQGPTLSFDVCLNDQIPMDSIGNYDGFVLSPGPGIPHQANQLLSLIAAVRYSHPVLGICLGHQALAESFGGGLRLLSQPLHGHKSDLRILETDDPIFKGLRLPVSVGRYHSWVVDAASLPPEMKVSSVDEDGEVMSIYHTQLPIHGLQFHPESHLSDQGAAILKNWADSIR